MPFETLENLQAATADAIPEDGVKIGTRAALGRGKYATRYIKIQIGAKLAKKLVLTGESVPVEVAFGSGSDTGKIRVSVDVKNGQFTAKRDKSSRYSFTINRKTADGLFSVNFPAFTITDIEPEYDPGKPPAMIIEASEEMLKVED